MPSGKSYYQTTSGDEITSFRSIVELILPAVSHTQWEEKTVFSSTNDANLSIRLSALLLSHGVLYGTASGYGTGPGFSGTIFSYKP